MDLQTAVTIPTPRAEDSESCGAHRGKPDTLTSWTKQYPTPKSRDWKDSPGMAFEGVNPDGSHRDRTDSLSTRVYSEPNTPVGSLNPDWVELLMGWPKGFTSLDPLPRENWERWLANGGAWSDGQWWPTPVASQPGFGDDPTGKRGRKLQVEVAVRQFQTPSAADGLGGHLSRSGKRKDELLLSGDCAKNPNPTAAWEQNTPRVATGIKNRPARLKAIGNGQVPLCVRLAWEILS